VKRGERPRTQRETVEREAKERSFTTEYIGKWRAA